MIDIKEVITILCKHLSYTVDSPLTTEHFRLAKYDNNSEDIINAFWITLDKLTHLIIKEENDQISFNDFDKYIRTKLRLAYLQCPFIKIYSLGITSNSSSRTLLIVFAWLITKYEVLENIVRLKLLCSSLGREFSKVNVHINNCDNVKLSTVPKQINNILHKSNKLSGNLKAISELYTEKIKLMTRVHTASITASGLPHLTVSEMALIKKIKMNKDKNEIEFEKIKEMEKTALILETHMKWTKRSHVFHTWMSTVLNEFEKSEKSTFTEEDSTELVRFIYLLRHIIKKRLKLLKYNDHCLSNLNSVQDCPSRLLRIQKCMTEVHSYLIETSNELDTFDDDLQKKRADLEIELKSILNLIPNCVHV